MLEFIERLLRRRDDPEPGSLVEELWVAQLKDERGGRFVPIEEEGYSARYAAVDEGGTAASAPEGARRGGLGGRLRALLGPLGPGAEGRRARDRDGGRGVMELELRRSNLLAWTEAPQYRQADFVLEGRFELAEAAPYSACGFLFRYQDEADFYSLMVSNRGRFRLDAVFNGSPRPLVAWTEIPATGPAFSLTLVARGSHFTVLVDERWVGEAVDETFRQGHLAFAAEAFEGPVAARLSACRLDSRPLEVEAAYYRWNYVIAPEAAARRALAQTFFAMGEHLAAAVQIRKMERRAPLGAGDLFLKAEVSLRLGLHDEAQAALDGCLALDPADSRAAEEKANLLYLRGDSLELRGFVDRLLEADPGNARLLGLAGHARFSLGDYAGAAAFYRRAADLDAEQPLFRMNEARAHDQAGAKKEAAEAYLAAARLLALQGGDDDLALALRRLESLRPRSAATKEIRAKALYRRGERAEAARLLEELVAKGSRDSAVHYLAGMAAAERGDGALALERFAAAARLEPEYPLYAFRYAERLFLEREAAVARGIGAGAGDARPAAGAELRAAIDRALALAPKDGWTLNLAGQEAMDAGDSPGESPGDLTRARAMLEAAREALPREAPVAINLAELESREGRVEEALAVLAGFPEQAACRNQAGNVLARAGRLEEAIREYERACRQAPAEAEYRCNLAAAYLEAERYSDAEDAIRRALDSGAGPRALLLAGNLAMEYGERPRAESAYRLGLEAAPGDPGLLFALGRCHLAGRNAAKAAECARLLAGRDPERASRLVAEIEEATTERLSCASCGRTWRVPRDLPPQSAASVRAMPPDDSPAGACPRCGEIYCIGCRKAQLAGKRFTCPRCGESLKLADDRLRYLVRASLDGGAGSGERRNLAIFPSRG